MTATDPRPGILRKAVDVLNARGRAYGEYFTPGEDPNLSDCKVCALGAIALAAGCDLNDMSLWDPQDTAEDLAMDAARALAEHLGLLGIWEDPNTVINVVGTWHDGIESDNEIAVALIAAADALERGEQS